MSGMAGKISEVNRNNLEVIASTLLKQLVTEYENFLYIVVVPDEKKNIAFYEKNGFTIMPEGTPLQIRGKAWI